MKYFTLEELCYSDTARELNINNVPTSEIEQHLILLIECLLDPLREAWGSPILVNSGYRCPTLNKIVGGSKTSAHMTGWAADIVPKNGKMKEFKEFVVKFITNKIWDQCILEQSGDTEWIHISLYNNNGKQRRQMFSLDV